MTTAPILKSWRRLVLVLTAILLVLAVLAAVSRSSLAESDDGAAQFVRDFGDQAIAMLSDPALGPEDKEREFRRLLSEGFHLDLIGRFVLGRHWRSASDEERAEFRRLFEGYLVASYGRQLANYSGERLMVDGARVQGERGALVGSRITRLEGEPVRVEWRLRWTDATGATGATGGGWKIIDVLVEGISMAVTHRSEFAAVIGSHGGRIEGLLQVLRDKTLLADRHAVAEIADKM